MMQIDAIERYVDQVLEVNGVVKGTEGQERLLLSHLYTAVGMYQLLDKTQKAHIAMLQKQLRHFFYAKCDLKERKRKKDKEKTPLHPSIKEKENKEKEQKNPPTAVRREMFHQECLGYADKFNIQLLSDFYNYWSEEDTQTNKMRFEKQRQEHQRNRDTKADQKHAAVSVVAVELQSARIVFRAISLEAHRGEVLELLCIVHEGVLPSE
jgi:hypothetical protein